MGGLIPLLLPSTSGSSRSSVIGISEARRPVTVMVASTPRTAGHRKQQSLPIIKPMKRLSTPVLPPLSVLPYTAAEWKKSINDIKQKYVSRKYRTCSARCCEILDNLKDTTSVEALHLVYLHFYAASSFEMCARPLSQSSTYRTKLLKDAREHYDRAAALIQKAEEAAAQKTRSASSGSMTCSMHSPSMSSSSRCSTMGSPLSSPRNSVSSVSSIEDLKVVAQPSKPKKKKKVSFSGLPDSIELAEDNWQPEPYIRPDSPTLGWEEDYFLFGQQEMTREPITSAPVVVEPTPEPAKTVAPKSETTAVEQHQFSSLLTSVPEEDKSRDLFDLDSFLQTRSMNRFCAQLSALRSQVSWHRDAVDGLLSQPAEVPETPTIPDVPPIPVLPALPVLAHSTTIATTSAGSSISDPESPVTPLSATISPRTLESALSQRLKDSFGNASSLDLSSHPTAATEVTSEPWDRSLTGSACSTVTSSSRPASAMSTSSRAGDEALQKRIERLRAGGWQRKRFDNRRYEALREQVLGELHV